MSTRGIRSFGRPPEYFSAIQALCPGAAFSIELNNYSTLNWLSPEIDKPSEDAIKAKLEELESAWNSQEYARTRFTDYPFVEDQLALLWDDMDAGIIPGKETSKWYAAIKEIKDNNPKS